MNDRMPPLWFLMIVAFVTAGIVAGWPTNELRPGDTTFKYNTTADYPTTGAISLAACSNFVSYIYFATNYYSPRTEVEYKYPVETNINGHVYYKIEMYVHKHSCPCKE